MQSVALNILRILIGWHFLYEGLIKLFSPFWSARSYLLDSGGFLADFFKYLAGSPAILAIIDPVNIWLLIIIGLALMLGVQTRYAALTGGILLFLYYLVQPPLIGIIYQITSPGSSLIVNPLLIEICALFVIYASPRESIWGVEQLVKLIRKDH
jgi:thiosulfate dehydrogenase [quinone] large subunit